MKVPVPDICEEERFQRLLSFRPTIGKRYKRTCDFSGESIVSNFPPQTRFPVYKKKYFDGDGRTAPSQDVDRSQPFFLQLQRLQEQTPRPHQLGEHIENCVFCDDVRDSRNCFLSVSMENCEQLYYSYRNVNCEYCYDTVFCFDCVKCYSCTYCFTCYECFRCLNSRECRTSYFLYDCQNCDHCFMCWNLKDKKYCIRNKQYTPEEYSLELAKLYV